MATLDEEDELDPRASDDRLFPVWGWVGAAALIVMAAHMVF